MLPELYLGREQTFIKHLMLRRYLEKLAYKVGSWCDTINFIDCFSGPWQHQSEDLVDTSPGIAIKELKRAQSALRKRGKAVNIRCLFIEKSPEACRTLRQKLEKEKMETTVLNGELEQSVSEISTFCKDLRSGKRFNFFFIDPTGWSGFSLDVIAPILRLEPGEVLINFMTQHINRFIDSHDDICRMLYGDLEPRKRWAGLHGLDRENEMVSAYAERIKKEGNFSYAVSSMVLHPRKERTHFHLVYATRHLEGLRVFRNDAESYASRQQDNIRLETLKRVREQRSGQIHLFFSPVHRSYGEELAEIFIDRMIDSITTELQASPAILFDQLEATALQYPFVSTKVLVNWLKEEQKDGNIAFQGLAAREKTPKKNKEHYVLWQGPGKLFS